MCGPLLDQVLDRKPLRGGALGILLGEKGSAGFNYTLLSLLSLLSALKQDCHSSFFQQSLKAPSTFMNSDNNSVHYSICTIHCKY